MCFSARSELTGNVQHMAILGWRIVYPTSIPQLVATSSHLIESLFKK